MNAEIRKKLNTIKKDRQHGASWLTACAMEILLDACDERSQSTTGHFVDSVMEIVDALISARPGMVSIANYAFRFGEEFKPAAAGSRSVINQQRKGFAIATRLNRLHEKSGQLLALKASRLVKNRTIVMTCSYSGSVCSTLEHAKSRGADFKVLAMQSKPGRISYGNMTMERLKKNDISCKAIPDDQIRWHIARADYILIGADAVSMQGWVLNGSPSYQLARAADARKIPVYALCNKSKFDPKGFLASMREPQEGFDMIPHSLLTGIVTESGIFNSEKIDAFSFEDIFR